MEPSRYALRVLLHWARDGLGPPLLARLKEQGCWVRIVGPESGLEEDLHGCDDVIVCDGKEADLSAACQGMDAVVAWAMPWLRLSRVTGGDADPLRHLRLLEAAKRSGMGHFVLITGLQTAGMARRWPELGELERLVWELRQSDLSWLVIRCPAFFEHMGFLVDLARKGTLYLPKNGVSLLNPIHTHDLSTRLVELLLDSTARKRVLPIGGPEVLSLRQLGELAFEAIERPPRFRNLAPNVLAFVSEAISPFVPVLSQHLVQVQALTGSDMVAPPYGSRRIGDWFLENARA
jgi:uncharacterized protein YbjT (DUF2867 family)